MIKTWVQASQRTVKSQTIKWDGEATSQTIDVPATKSSVLIVFDNQSQTTLTATLDQLAFIDNTNASAEIGAGLDVIDLTVDEAGPEGNEYTIEVVVPEEAGDLIVSTIGKDIFIILAVDAEGVPDDTKNTVTAIVSAINDEETGIAGITATTTGTGAISEAIEAVQFTGGTTEVWAEYYELENTAFSLTATAEKTICYGPFQAFPKFYGGRITLTAGTAPTAEEITRVRVLEI